MRADKGNRKKVDARLKTLEEKTEAKKMEVMHFAAIGLMMLRSGQCVKLQGEIQEQQKSNGQRQ